MSFGGPEAIVLALLLAGLIALFAVPWRSRRLKHRLGERAEIDIGRQITKHYGSEAIDPALAAELWRSIAACYGVAPGKLRPDDGFAKELGTKRLFAIDDENSCVNLLISGLIATHAPSTDIAQLRTIDDCIRTLCRSR